MNSKLLKNQGDNFISTGFSSLDEILGGFRSSGLYTLAGAPSIGKTTLALTIVKQLADNNIPVGVFSYELTEKQIMDRFLAMENNLPYEKISFQKNLLEHELAKIHTSLSKVQKLPIFIESSPSVKIDQLVTITRDLKENKDIQLLFIDDIQRMPIDDVSREYAANREQEISANVRELKRLAKELNIPILMISQLNRMFISRVGDKRPILSDLRDSGAIENDSDVVLFLYRAEHYGLFENEQGISSEGLAEIMIAKNRHGKSNVIVNLTFDNNIPVFNSFKDSENFDTVNSMQSSMNMNSATINRVNFDSFEESDESPF